jgi:hypothetical protein
MASQSHAATLPHQTITVDHLKPTLAVQSAIVLRPHQKLAALCFAGVGLIAMAGWFYLIALGMRSIVRWLAF